MSTGTMGPSSWDDAGALVGDLVPRYGGQQDLGVPGRPFRNLRLTGTVILSDLEDNGLSGEATANGATAVVVTTDKATPGMQVLFTLKTVGGTPAGAPYLSAIVDGTSFSFKAAAGDTSVYTWTIIGLP